MIKLFIVLMAFLFASCTIFDTPEGEAELMDSYIRNEQGYVEEYFTFGTDSIDSSDHRVKKTEEVLFSYLCTTIKIKNTGKSYIYNSTISLEAKAGDRTYYKTVSLDISIAPGATVYIPIELEKYTKQLKAAGNNNDSEWDKSSIKILDVSWR